MTAKEYLEQIHNLDVRIKDKIQEREEIMTMATNITVPPDSEFVQTSTLGNKIENAAVKLAMLQDELTETVFTYIEIRSSVIKTIDEIKDPTVYDIIFQRYVKCLKMEDVAKEVHLSTSQMKRLHQKGLYLVTQIAKLDGK